MIYPILKLVHIMSSTILFGGGIFAALLASTTLADLLTLLLPADPDLAVRTPPRA
jgi:hypothetical protein